MHIIDKVLTVPLNVSSSAAAAGLSALVGALQAEKLTQTVDELKNVTIFAPANSAFQAIGSALGNLTADQLSGILEYHVLNGTLAYSTDLKNDTQYTAVDGRNITVRIENGSVFVDSARVVTPNLLVANGVVHVIDKYVLISSRILMSHSDLCRAASSILTTPPLLLMPPQLLKSRHSPVLPPQVPFHSPVG